MKAWGLEERASKGSSGGFSGQQYCSCNLGHSFYEEDTEVGGVS